MRPDCYDVILLGSGLAGLYAALHLAEGGHGASPRVLMLSKQAPGDSGSSLAQGGVAAVLEQEDDSFALHAEDTLIAGNFTNDRGAVDVLVREGPEDVRRVMDLGVEFDRAPGGELQRTLEGGHSRRRIVHHADQTGREMVDKLLPQVQALQNTILWEGATAVAARREEGGFLLDVLYAGARKCVWCACLLLATGGIGRVYRYTTNPPVCTGDGIRLACELGAALKNMRLVQFHPTAFAGKRGAEETEQFLISEAVRGEGAYLLNARGERFMRRYDERLELAPRDVVSRAILHEARRVDAEDFFLDIRHRGAAFLLERFPTIAAACRARGVDIARDRIPVFPCQHYLMGGIDVDLHGRTSVPGLYAAGECAHTGLHGGNRLASNSLPEALVFGRRAAADIFARLRGVPLPAPRRIHAPTACAQAPAPEECQELRKQIRDILQEAYFVEPNLNLLPEATARMERLYRSLHEKGTAVTRAQAELHSLALVAWQILKDARERLLP
ncbi:MAG: FAD-binding protein [Oscillospiraceae bacterium]|nr:FAD-binding protein [Oscillospiraceae bacterium]